eukprot:2417649-Amphidinium_carterae.1
MGLSSARFFQWYRCQGYDEVGQRVHGLRGAWSYVLLLRPAAPRWDCWRVTVCCVWWEVTVSKEDELMDAPAAGTTMDVSYGTAFH